VTDIFTGAQYTVIGALDALEGIALYRRQWATISAVILDYSMPGMNGKAVFEELVTINRDVRALLCSGYSEEEMASAFGEVRPAGFLHKPYRPTVLVERTSQLLSA
jgi:DNA-binding NarL/FixJ family response regulator